MIFKRVPLSLIIVIIIFILEGVYSLIKLFKTLTSDYHNINFIAVGFFIGPGLLTLKNWWRIIALIFLWFVIISLSMIIIGILFQTSTPDIFILGLSSESPSKELNLVIAALLLIVSIWEYRLLIRSDIRKLYTKKQGR